MNKQEFRKLIREEIRKVLNESLVVNSYGIDLLPDNVDIAVYEDGYWLQYQMEDPSMIQKAINILRKTFAEIQPNLQAKLVGQPKTYKAKTGFTRFDGDVEAVGLKFKTNLTVQDMRKLYPQNVINFRIGQANI